MLTGLQITVGLQIALLALVLVLLFGAYAIVKAVKPLIANAVVGLIVLLAAGFFGVGVQISPMVVLLVAFGGVPAAVLVIVLAQAGVLFETAVVLPLLPFS